MTTAALLMTALLFGGMVLYSFGFAAFLFTALPAETAGPTIRRAFPHFYLFVFATAVLGAALSWPVDPPDAGHQGLIAPLNQRLIPAADHMARSPPKALSR